MMLPFKKQKLEIKLNLNKGVTMKEYKSTTKKYSFAEKIDRTLKYAWREKYINRLDNYLSDDENFYTGLLQPVNEWLEEKRAMSRSEAVAKYFIDEQVNEIKSVLKEEFIVRMTNEEVIEKGLTGYGAESAVFKYVNVIECIEFEYDNKNGFKEIILVSDYLRVLVTKVYFDGDDFRDKRETLKREIQDLFRAIVIYYKMNYEQKMIKKLARSKGGIQEFLILRS